MDQHEIGACVCHGCDCGLSDFGSSEFLCAQAISVAGALHSTENDQCGTHLFLLLCKCLGPLGLSPRRLCGLRDREWDREKDRSDWEREADLLRGIAGHLVKLSLPQLDLSGTSRTRCPQILLTRD